MSRAYRIKIRETLRRVLRAEDHVSSQLELLEILPRAQMGELLGDELVRRGFKRSGDSVRREQQGVSVSVDLTTGTVTVCAEAAEKVQLEVDKERVVYGDLDQTRKALAKDALRKQLREGLEKVAERKTGDLQKQATDRLESQLANVTREMDQAVNRATAEALKRKAAQLGQIKSMADDPESGSLMIVVEV